MKRVNAVWSGLGGSPYYSTFYATGGETTPDCQAFHNAVATALDNMANYLSNNVVWATEPVVMLVDAASGNPYAAIAVTPDNGAGAHTSETLPRATQGLLQLRTGVFEAGREVRGRVFLPAPPEVYNTDLGSVSTDYSDTVTTIWDTHLLNANVGWCVWSRTHGDAFVINAVQCAGEWAVLRSRRD